MKYKLKKLEELDIGLIDRVKGIGKSEFSITQSEMRALRKYLLDQYKRTGNEQFKRWAVLITGYITNATGRNVNRAIKAGGALYRILKRK